MNRRGEADGTGALSTAVIDAIAEHEGIDPLELEQPLYEVIDLDALDALFARPGPGAGSTVDRLTFSYNGCEIQVTGEGDVRISDTDDR